MAKNVMYDLCMEEGQAVQILEVLHINGIFKAELSSFTGWLTEW